MAAASRLAMPLAGSGLTAATGPGHAGPRAARGLSLAIAGYGPTPTRRGRFASWLMQFRTWRTWTGGSTLEPCRILAAALLEFCRSLAGAFDGASPEPLEPCWSLWSLAGTSGALLELATQTDAVIVLDRSANRSGRPGLAGRGGREEAMENNAISSHGAFGLCHHTCMPATLRQAPPSTSPAKRGLSLSRPEPWAEQQSSQPLCYSRRASWLAASLRPWPSPRAGPDRVGRVGSGSSPFRTPLRPQVVARGRAGACRGRGAAGRGV